MNKVLIALFLSVTCLTAQTVLRLNGSTTVNNALVKPNQAAIEAATGGKLQVTANGSGNGLTDLAEGRADVAMISAPLSDVAGKVNSKKAGTIEAAQFKEFLVGKTQVAFVVNSAVGIESLTGDQMKSLLIGTVKNWKDVGGADQPVVVVVPAIGDGIRTTLEETLMKGSTFVADARVLQVTNQIPVAVKALPGGLGILGVKGVAGDVKVVKLDKEISASLYLVTKGEPTVDMKKLIDAVKSKS